MTTPEITLDTPAKSEIGHINASFCQQLVEMAIHHVGREGRDVVTVEDVRRFGFCITGPSFVIVPAAENQTRENKLC